MVYTFRVTRVDWRRGVAGTILITASVAGVLGMSKLSSPGDLVVKVTNGNTFTLTNKQAIVLDAVKTPEPDYCWGEEAKNELSRLILNKRVTIRQPYVDDNRRIAALVYAGDKLMNEEVIRNGFGEFGGEAGEETVILRDAGSYARQNAVGVYSKQCWQKDPPETGCAIKGSVELGQKVFYTPDCRYYSEVIVKKFLGDSWFCREAEAKRAGFAKSDAC